MANIGDAAQSPGDLVRRVHELEGLVRELIAGRRLENATVGAGGMRVKGAGGITLQEGGGLTVLDGGDIIIRGDGVLYMEDAEGQAIVYIGADATGKQVFQLRRENGEPILATQGSDVWGRDFWSFWDSSGQIVLSDDAETGWGLAKPRIVGALYPHYTCLPDSIGTTESPTFVDLWEGELPINNPWLRVGMLCTWAPGSEASGIVQVTFNDEVVYESDEITNTKFNTGRLDATAGQTRFFGSLVSVKLKARRTSGTGTLVLAPLGLYAN